MTTVDRLEAAFGVPEFPDCLFYQFRYALRFELGGEELGMERPVARFLRAIDRSRRVVETLFASSTDLVTVFSSFASDEPPVASVKEALDDCGFNASGLICIRSTPQHDLEHIEQFGEDLFRHWFSRPLPDQHGMDELLWCSLAAEMPITPSARLISYIVDPSLRLVAHPYDDRGMDLVAMERAPLQPLYSNYRQWLTADDLDRMDATFAEA